MRRGPDNSPRAKTDFARRLNRIGTVTRLVAENPLVPSGKSPLRPCAILAREEGRFGRSPRTLGKDAMDAWVSQASDADADGQVVWSRSPDAGIKLASDLASDGG